MHELSSKPYCDAVPAAVADLDEIVYQNGGAAKPSPLAGHLGNLRAAAKRRLPRAVFGYLEGGSYEEVTLRANIADLCAVRLRQRVFVKTAARRKAVSILGQNARIPVGLAPAGLAGVFYPQGEIHAARAADAFGVPFCLSTLSTCSIEDVARASRSPFLFQLYLFKDRGINAALIDRAMSAGCSALVLTLDTAVQCRRNRDLDNGLTVPLKPRLRHVLDLLAHLEWTCRFLTSRPTFANLTMFVRGNAKLSEMSAWAERHFKGAVDLTDLEWVREVWPGKLVVKGILDAEDAALAVARGADAIVVSNHGGRQLDCAETSVKAFPAIRDAVGDAAELIFDSGIRSGLDVLKALGLGARGCLIGRAYLYGLAAHGEAGVTAGLELIAQELDTAMTLTGVDDVRDVPSGLLIKAAP
jgi:L-lactate dehydrogenase (cytochrome)